MKRIRSLIKEKEGLVKRIKIQYNNIKTVVAKLDRKGEVSQNKRRREDK